jgi:6-phosphogluconolactonase (cycloisomerase 2 family)
MEESLQMISTTEAGYRPSWLHSKGKYLYSLSRSHFPDNSSLNAGIFCFEKYPGGHLHLLNTSTAPGDGGVYMDTNPHGTMLASANM